MNGFTSLRTLWYIMEEYRDRKNNLFRVFVKKKLVLGNPEDEKVIF